MDSESLFLRPEAYKMGINKNHMHKREAADVIRSMEVPECTVWTRDLAESIYHIADHVRQTHPAFLMCKLHANEHGVRLGGDPPGTIPDALHSEIPWWDIYLTDDELVVRVTDMRFLRPAIDEDEVANRLEELLKELLDGMK